MTSKNIAFIPMRGGSKSIPQKNIKEIAGKPLCFWTINSALDCHFFDKIFVSTDAAYIELTVQNLFPEAIKAERLVITRRPPQLAEDTTSTEAVIMDFVSGKEFETFCLIQATSPLLTKEDLQSGFDKFIGGKFDSLLSTCRIKRFFWSEEGEPVNYDYLSRPRRQDFKGQLVENGAFYFSTAASLLKNKNRLGGKIGTYEMHEDSFFELDEPIDLEIIQALLQKRMSQVIPPIQAIVIDVDGTLTDGGMYYSESGESLKKFNTTDAHGIGLARKQGIRILILTAESSPSVHSRFQKVQVDDYAHGIKDKKSFLLKWSEANKIELDKVLYIGDDLGDLEAMALCGIKASPKNAVSEIKKISTYCANLKGGNGAVREIIEKFLPKS